VIVEFGVQVWDEGLRETGNTPQAMTRVTQAAEELGFDHVWINDHVITPVSQEKSYYPIGGAPWPLPPDADVHDPLAVLAMLGAVTDRIRIGTSTLVVPLRAPLPTIKALITIDHISAGRLTLGFAPGWWKEEFEVLGLPWEARGAVLDEYLDVFALACGGGIHDFHGTHVSFDEVPFFPPSVQQPRIRMVSCGTSVRALRRGSRFDGLFRILTPVAEVKGIVDRMRAEAEQAGNDPDNVKLYDFQAIVIADGATQFEGVTDLPLAGPADRLMEVIAEYEAAGMHQLVSGFTSDPFGSTTEQVENMEQFAREVMHPYRGQ
jgi:probable F420-dependent oxidoreductase